MLYAVSGITQRVRIALDENDVVVPLIATDSNTLTLDQIIKQKIVDAVRSVSDIAPINLLQDAPSFGDNPTIVWGVAGEGCITLPSDFLRLVAFRMSDWQRAVPDAIEDNSPEYLQQKSRFKGVHGNPDKPVCAIRLCSNGSLLEFYSCKSSSATVEVAKYIPIPAIRKIDNVEEIEICERILTPVIYYAAALTATTVASQGADSLFKLATNYIT